MISILLLLPAAIFSESPPGGSTGLNFIVAFPENIAYYHPTKPQNMVQITALHANTRVTLKQHTYHTGTHALSAGETKKFTFDARMELTKAKISNKSLQISSNEEISVHAVSLRGGSVQTAAVIPTDKLGKRYLIPPVPRIRGTTEPDGVPTAAVTEREPFKLVIANGDRENPVFLQGGDQEEEISLLPYQIAQIWVNRKLRIVTAAHPISVIFGHTCAVRANCTCGLLYVVLPATSEEEMELVVPPDLAVEGETFLLLSEKESTKVQPFNPDSPLVKISGNAILHRPGLLLSLIPEEEFGACWVVNGVPEATNFAVVVVREGFTDGVHVGELPLQNPEWKNLKGTKFVSTRVALPPKNGKKNVIWHNAAKMAVFFLGEKDGATFGNPAAAISKTPDFRGCVLSPEVVEIGEVAAGWRESVKSCRDRKMELLSFHDPRLQTQIHQKLLQARAGELWLGLRRGSLLGSWLWLDGAPLGAPRWAEGAPGGVQDGQCASMTVGGAVGGLWRDEDCCKALHPICYRNPVLLPL